MGGRMIDNASHHGDRFLARLGQEALQFWIGASGWQGFSPTLPLLGHEELTELLVLLGVNIQWWRMAGAASWRHLGAPMGLEWTRSPSRSTSRPAGYVTDVRLKKMRKSATEELHPLW